MSKARAKKIKLLLLDVDGVMTDGKIFLFPVPAALVQPPRSATRGKAGASASSDAMIEAKGFNAHDGAGFSLHAQRRVQHLEHAAGGGQALLDGVGDG